MKQPEELFKYEGQHRHRGLVAGPQPHLGHLQIPVAVLTPEEVVGHSLGFPELVGLHELLDLGDNAVEPAEYPAVLQVRRAGRQDPPVHRIRVVQSGHYVARRIP